MDIKLKYFQYRIYISKGQGIFLMQNSMNEKNRFRINLLLLWENIFIGYAKLFLGRMFHVGHRTNTDSQYQHTCQRQVSTFHRVTTEATETFQKRKMSFSLKHEYSLLYSIDIKDYQSGCQLLPNPCQHIKLVLCNLNRDQSDSQPNLSPT